MVLRQAEALRDRARALNADARDAAARSLGRGAPRYQSAIDNHCMPGSYFAEHLEDDVSAAANYDAGMFATTTGLFGRFLDGAGRGVVAWLADRRPGWRPRASSTSAAVSATTPCRSGVRSPMRRSTPSTWQRRCCATAMRAAAMGVRNIRFTQGNVEQLPFPAGHFDFVLSTMFLHEISHGALRRILRETDRVLAAGGLAPAPRTAAVPRHGGVREVSRDCQATTTTSRSGPRCTTPTCRRCSARTGSRGDRVFETRIDAIVDDEMPKVAGEVEDFGRGGMWYAFGSDRAPFDSWKAPAGETRP